MARTDLELVERFRFAPDQVATIGRPVLARDSIRLSEDLTQLYATILRETIALREDFIGNQIAQLTLSDVFRFLDRLYRAQAATLSDVLGLTQSETLQRAAVVIERLGILEQLTGGGKFQMTLVQGVRLVSKIALFFGLDIADELGISDVEFTRVLAYARATETVGVGGQLTPYLLMSVTVADGLEISPEQLVNMLYNPTLSEGIEFEAGYLAPDGTFTTWVMNTRSGAVTEYDNFVFNSFAQVGHTYLGASDAGLYELLGDDDDGEDIVARIRGGYLQFGGTQLSRLKEAYIAAEGEGTFILRLRTADGVDYNYRVDARDGRSTKVHMGKGQRSRYFGYELVTAGQDFTLDTLEFVPLVMQRRV